MTNGNEILFLDYCKKWEKIGNTSKTKEKAEIIEKNINKFGFSWLTLGKYSNEYNLKNLNFSKQRIILFLESYFNISKEEIKVAIKNFKDLGEVAEYFLNKNFESEYPTNKLNEVIAYLQLLSEKQEIEDKNKILEIIFDNSYPFEIKYIIRLILQDMKIGVKENLILKAFASRYNKTIEDIKYLFYITNDFLILQNLLESGINPKNIQLTPGIPIKPMLSHKMKEIPTNPQYYEIKYDGVRVQIHNIIKENGENEIKIFTRNLEDVTESLPEITALFIGQPVEFIIEAELLAFENNGKPAPFKNVMTRLKRKKNTTQMAIENPLMPKIFDILYYNENLIENSFENRTKLLSKIFPEDFLTTFIKSGDLGEINEFFKKVISEGFEGLMVKNPNEKYYVGERKNAVVKWKPKFHDLDVVVINGNYGSGKNHDKIKILEVGLINKNAQIINIGKVSSGIKDEELEELTKLYNENQLKGKIIEVSFAEVTKTENNEYRMRFPIFKGFRYDKLLGDINLIQDIEEIYNKQVNK